MYTMPGFLFEEVFVGKPFITREGYDLLRRELDELWNTVRPKVTQKVSWAASLGDRSENADYHYNKRLLGQIDRRIRYLRHCMNDLQIITEFPYNSGKVYFGAYVEIISEDNDESLFIRIVGGEEIFGRSNYISVDSPMAKALLGKSVGDTATVITPKGKRFWDIEQISYSCPEWFTELPVIENSLFDSDSQTVVQQEELSENEREKIEQDYLKAMVDRR